MPFKVTQGIRWVITCTTNFDETVAFFRDVMGLPISSKGVPVIDTQFTRYAQFKMPNEVMLEIVEPNDTVRDLLQAPIVCITVDNVARARSEMASQAIEFVSPIFSTPGGWCWTYFRAPEGNVYQIQGPYMDMATVVLDTNVLVAAGFNPRSSSSKIVNAVREGNLQMVWNDATRRETERILNKIPPLRSFAIAGLFRPEGYFGAATGLDEFSTIPDPEDRKFAALAYAAGAVLITNDDHLLTYQGENSLKVLTPSSFWNRQEDGDNSGSRG